MTWEKRNDRGFFPLVIIHTSPQVKMGVGETSELDFLQFWGSLGHDVHFALDMLGAKHTPLSLREEAVGKR